MDDPVANHISNKRAYISPANDFAHAVPGIEQSNNVPNNFQAKHITHRVTHNRGRRLLLDGWGWTVPISTSKPAWRRH